MSSGHIAPGGATPVAIVGIGCRFPGGITSPFEYWEALLARADCTEPIPGDRWNVERFHDASPLRSDRIIPRRGGFIRALDMFDADFFGISRREAEEMDPQQRHFLEVAYEALEDACVNPGQLAGRPVGVYAGVSSHDYADLQQSSATASVYSNTGYALSMVANRLSYQLDLRGPSVTLDTACSSSSVALHFAHQSMVAGDCEVAIVGGVNLIVNPNLSIGFSRAGMLSPGGRSRPFDAAADGYVRSEGIGAVVLMPLDDAIERGLDVYATVAGTKINQDGRTHGITHPSEDAQAALVTELYSSLGISPEHVSYVEAHGTGTVVGDGVETAALRRALGAARGAAGPLRIGSVKGNLGHLEAASGIAGVIKTALCLRHRRWVPSINCTDPRPDLPLGDGRLTVQVTVEPWRPGPTPRIAGVNSFGFGGTNAHAVLVEPAPVRVPAGPAPPSRRAFPVTASTPAALDAARARLAQFLRAHPDVSLADISHTLCTIRPHHRLRELHVAETAGELCESLARSQVADDPRDPGEQAIERARRRRDHPLVAARNPVATPRGHSVPAGRTPQPAAGLLGDKPAIAFLFAGQGGQWADVARTYVRRHADFRDAVCKIDAAFAPLAGWSLVDLVEHSGQRVTAEETAIVQPLTFAIQVGVAACWRAWGIEPDLVIGHSLGEVAAAHVAGALSLADATTLIYERSRLQATTSRRGRMIVVAADGDAIRELLGAPGWPGLVVAAHNSAELWTLAGDRDEVQALAGALASRGTFHRILDVEHAFHTTLMDPILDELRAGLSAIEPTPTSAHFYSTVTGTRLAGPDCDAGYWWRNVRDPVLFDEAVRAARAAVEGEMVWIEIGPPVLERTVRAIVGAGTGNRVLASLRPDDHGHEFETAVGEAFRIGMPLTWGEPSATVRPVRLPSYPWDRRSFWHEAVPSFRRRRSPVDHPWLSAVGMRESEWTLSLSTTTLPMLADHRVAGTAVLPAAAYLDVLLSMPLSPPGDVRLFEDVRFRRVLPVPSQAPVDMQVTYEPEAHTFTVCTSSADHRHAPMHCQGNYRAISSLAPPQSINPEEVWQTYPRRLAAPLIYARMTRLGLHYGPAFRALQEAAVGDDEAFALVAVDADDARFAEHPFHPVCLDACFQAAILAAGDVGALSTHQIAVLPVGIRRMEVYASPTRQCWVRARATSRSSNHVEVDLDIYAADGEPVARVVGLRSRIAVTGAPATGGIFYRERWDERPHDAGPVEHRRILAVAFEPAVADAVDEALGDDNEVVWLGDPRRGAPGEWSFGEVAAARREDEFDDLVVVAPRSPASSDPFRAAPDLRFLALLAAVAADVRRAPAFGFHVLTTAGQRVGDDDAIPDSGAAMVIAAARAVATEHPSWNCRLTDVERLSPEIVRRALADTSDETEVAYRAGRRLVVRLEDRPAETVLPRSRTRRVRADRVRFELQAAGNRLIESTGLVEVPRRAPGPGQVEVRVRAAAINFRDVMKVLGMYPAEDLHDEHLGDECAGVVVRAGKGVELAVGTEVLALAPGAMASFVTCPATSVYAKPAGLSFEEAAGVQVAAMTAYYALVHLARIERGERVLIHSATGGVGLMAVQIAMARGATVLATAGSDDKRAFLSSLGIEHVYDSRRLDFAAGVLADTGGRGVDVVLNAIAGDGLRLSLDLLAPFGRFVEIGKIDIHDNRPLAMRALKDNISFHAVDLVQLFRERPEQTRACGEAVLEMLARGALRVLGTTSFPITEATGALRHVSRAEHIGKVVLTIPDGRVTVRRPADPSLAKIRRRGSYVVTGGYSGFGLATAAWLAEQGARTLVLVGRSGRPDPLCRRRIDALIAEGITIEVAACDVGDADAVAALLARVRDRLPPIRGIFHAAATVPTAGLAALDPAAIDAIVGAKVRGTAHLHAASLDDPLDYFVCYSSVATVLGDAGQAVYAAANAYQDAFADARAAAGLPALTVALGAVADVGMVARDPTWSRRFDHLGLGGFGSREALNAVAHLLNRGETRCIAARIDWRQLASGAPHVSAQPRYAELAGAQGLDRTGVASLRQQLRRLAPGRRKDALRRWVEAALADVLRFDPSQVDTGAPLVNLGLDSLAAMEFQAHLGYDYAVEFSASDFTPDSTIDTVVEAILTRITTATETPSENQVGDRAGSRVSTAQEEP